MATWYRIFSKSDLEPDPDALAAIVGPDASCQRHDGEQGWRRLDFLLLPDTELVLERYRREEEGIRAELQAWAAWLETLDNEPEQDRLMLHLATTAQVFAMERENSNDPLALKLCEAIAWMTDGVYEIDGLGFFANDGTLLVPEND
jgi:hypothetical protein